MNVLVVNTRSGGTNETCGAFNPYTLNGVIQGVGATYNGTNDTIRIQGGTGGTTIDTSVSSPYNRFSDAGTYNVGVSFRMSTSLYQSGMFTGTATLLVK